jgi:hypothetical protein
MPLLPPCADPPLCHLNDQQPNTVILPEHLPGLVGEQPIGDIYIYRQVEGLIGIGAQQPALVEEKLADRVGEI